MVLSTNGIKLARIDNLRISMLNENGICDMTKFDAAEIDSLAVSAETLRAGADGCRIASAVIDGPCFAGDFSVNWHIHNLLVDLNCMAPAEYKKFDNGLLKNIFAVDASSVRFNNYRPIDVADPRIFDGIPYNNSLAN